ncbi:hypothetical protein [Paracoccus mutanolyticus]|uniref:hypothetical protein n=1 Tax=Paracoccus mutanolyticus TaxID=1499308 RepID=UPI0016797B57|nr:hypothetical protein [Paracoccus mutanolyticus]
MIDSRDFLAAKRRAETEVMLPAGPRWPCRRAGFNDRRLIWGVVAALEHREMVL